MATDYDAPRKTDEELNEDSIEELKTRRNDKNSGKVDEDEAEGTGSPLIPTASWGYLRLRRVTYDEDRLRTWAERILSQTWSEAYVFLKHEDGSPTGPAAATQISGILQQIRKT